MLSKLNTHKTLTVTHMIAPKKKTALHAVSKYLSLCFLVACSANIPSPIPEGANPPKLKIAYEKLENAHQDTVHGHFVLRTPNDKPSIMARYYNSTGLSTPSQYSQNPEDTLHAIKTRQPLTLNEYAGLIDELENMQRDGLDTHEIKLFREFQNTYTPTNDYIAYEQKRLHWSIQALLAQSTTLDSIFENIKNPEDFKNIQDHYDQYFALQDYFKLVARQVRHSFQRPSIDIYTDSIPKHLKAGGISVTLPYTKEGRPGEYYLDPFIIMNYDLVNEREKERLDKIVKPVLSQNTLTVETPAQNEKMKRVIAATLVLAEEIKHSIDKEVKTDFAKGLLSPFDNNFLHGAAIYLNKYTYAIPTLVCRNAAHTEACKKAKYDYKQQYSERTAKTFAARFTRELFKSLGYLKEACSSPAAKPDPTIAISELPYS